MRLQSAIRRIPYIGAYLNERELEKSRARVEITANLDSFFEFRFSNPATIKRGPVLFERRDASIEFYTSCLNGDVDLEDNPFLIWMEKFYPEGWHGARNRSERVSLCKRFQGLLFNIAENGIREPVRLLEPRLFEKPHWHNRFDGGNRSYIAAALNLETIPCLIHPAHRRFAKRHGII